MTTLKEPLMRMGIGMLGQDGILTIRAFGASPVGDFDNTVSIQKAIDAASGEGGGVVLIPQGRWLTGTLQLRSRVTLNLAKNAVLQASADAERYPHFRHNTWSRMDLFPWRAFIFGDNLEDVTINGEGTIECGGEHAVFQDKIGNSPDRPYGIHLVNCRNVRIEGVCLRNSGHWMLRCLECKGVTVRGIDVFNHCNANNDGMDIDSCEDVIITECRVDSSDDGICLKSEGASPCRNVVVSNCLVSSHASAIKFGTASIGGFRNIVVNNCIIRPSHSTVMHHPFRLWQGMTGIDISGVDGGKVEGISINNIAMEGPANPVFIRLGNRLSTSVIPNNRDAKDAKPSPAANTVAGMRGIRLCGITASEVGPLPTIIAGFEGHHIEDITLRDWDIRYSVAPDLERAAIPPNWEPSWYPCAWAISGHGDMPVSQFALRYINRLSLNNVRMVSAPRDPRPLRDILVVTHHSDANDSAQQGGVIS